MIVLHNPTEAPVKDYPIQNPETKEVLLWSISPGETLEFPDYAGKYLLSVYDFLQRVITEDQFQQEKEEEKKIQEGRVFSNIKIVKAEGEVVDSVIPPDPGFTNQNTQPDNARVEGQVNAPASLTNEPKPTVKWTCPVNTCKQEFKRENHLKVHYALKHIEIPTS